MKKDRVIRADLLMQAGSAAQTEQAHLAALQRAVYENLQTVSYLLCHLDRDNFKEEAWARLALDAASAAAETTADACASGQRCLCPRDEETGEAWHFRGGGIYCGTRRVL